MGNRRGHVLYVLIALLPLAACKKSEPDPELLAFEKRFESEAVLVRTCPGDPTLATGSTAAAQKVYRFQEELWFRDRGVLRRVDAKPENVCDVLVLPGGSGGVVTSLWQWLRGFLGF